MIDVTQAVVGFVMMLGFMALGLHVAVAMLDGVRCAVEMALASEPSDL